MIDLAYWRTRLAAQQHSGSPHVGLTTAQFAEILDDLEAGRERVEDANTRLELLDGANASLHRSHVDALRWVSVLDGALRLLISQARAEELSFDSGAAGRMSGLLEDVIAYAQQLEQDAAGAAQRLGRMAKWVQKRGHKSACGASVRQRPNGDVFGSLGPCTCGLAALLGGGE